MYYGLAIRFAEEHFAARFASLAGCLLRRERVERAVDDEDMIDVKVCGRSLAMDLIILPDLLSSRGTDLSLGDCFRFVFSPTTVQSFLRPHSAREISQHKSERKVRSYFF